MFFWEGKNIRKNQKVRRLLFPSTKRRTACGPWANELKFEAPTARQVTRSKRISFGFKGAAGEGGRSETAEFSGSLPLPRLAKALEEPLRYEGIGPATDAADAPLVSDEGVLSGAIEQIKSELPGTSETAELLSRVEEAYGTERVEAAAEKKRREFGRIGKRNQLLVIRGQFGLAQPGQGKAGPQLGLTHFNPTLPISPRASARGVGKRSKPISLPYPMELGSRLLYLTQARLRLRVKRGCIEARPFMRLLLLTARVLMTPRAF